MLITVLCDSPSRMVRWSKYMGRTSGTGGAAYAVVNTAHARKKDAQRCAQRRTILPLLFLGRRLDARVPGGRGTAARCIAIAPGVSAAPRESVAPRITTAPGIVVAPGMP